MAEIKQIKIEAVGLKNIKNELDDIKKSMKDVTDPSEMAKLTAEANVLEKQISDVNKGIKEMGESTTSAATSSQSLRKDLKDLENEMLRLYHTGQNNTEEFMKMHQAAADIRSSISNLNRETNLLGANDAPQQMVAGWQNVGTSLKNLDFATATKDAQRLSVLSKGISFKTATDSVKNLGKTFLNLGKALLTNPIFLLAAVIVGIVAAVYKLLDSLGIIQMAIDALMKPIQYLIDLFYTLSDAMGLTNEHATRDAEATAKAYEDSAERIKKSNDKVIQSFDHQIKMAQLNGESTVELERKKLVAMTETLEAEMDAAKARLKAAQMRGDLDEAEIKALQDKVDEYDLAYGKIKNTIVEFETKVSIDRKNALKAEQDAIEKSNMDKAAKAKAYREKQEAIRKQEAADRLSAQRLEEDLSLQLMEDGTEKAIQANKLKYERLIEDTITNEKLTEEEKIRVKQQYADLLIQEEKAINDKITEARKAKELEAQKELNALLYDLKTDEEQRALDELNLYYEENINMLREHLENGLITRAEFDEAETLLAQEKADKLKDIEEDLAQKKKDLEDEVAQKRRDNVADGLAIASQGINAIADLMQTSSDNEIAAAEGNEAKQEQLRKKAFEQQKKMQIASAFINMAQGIVAGLGAPFPMNIAMPVIAGVTGLASIAKIKSTSYSGGGGSGNIPKPTMPSTNTPTRQAPIVNFQGTGGNSNELSAGGGNSNITIENNVSVSETEITDKQKTVHNLTNQSQL